MFLRVQAHLSYNAAYRHAKRRMKESGEFGTEMYPKDLSSLLDEKAIAESVDVGVIDIPVDQIVGVADCVEEARYTAGFLPVSPTKSGYAEHWRELYVNYMEDKKFLSRLYCYEYLGKFYVVDGKKRVSILKSLGVSMTPAYVKRILPIASEEKPIQLYYEFLEYFKLTMLYQVSFSQLGSFKKLQKAMGHDELQVWNDEERAMVLRELERIDSALESAFGGYMCVTPADALLILLEEYSFKQIHRMATVAMSDYFQKKWKKLYGIYSADVNEMEPLNAQNAS